MKTPQRSRPHRHERDPDIEGDLITVTGSAWTAVDRVKPRKIVKPFPFGFGAHAASDSSKRDSGKNVRKPR